MAWTFKLGDDKACYADLKNYSDDACTTDQAADFAKAIDAAGTNEAFGTKSMVKSCEDKKIVVTLGADETAAKAADAEAITITFTQDKGVVGCTAAGTGNYVKFTAKAYSAPADGDADGETATGAMHLGAAFAAGALTIAATQF